MTPESFAYWLQGYFELSNSTQLTTEQVAIVKEHLQLVFKKETKSNLENKKVNVTGLTNWADNGWGKPFISAHEQWANEWASRSHITNPPNVSC